jgi:hypothetical protein
MPKGGVGLRAQRAVRIVAHFPHVAFDGRHVPVRFAGEVAGLGFDRGEIEWRRLRARNFPRQDEEEEG